MVSREVSKEVSREVSKEVPKEVSKVSLRTQGGERKNIRNTLCVVTSRKQAHSLLEPQAKEVSREVSKEVPKEVPKEYSSRVCMAPHVMCELIIPVL